MNRRYLDVSSVTAPTVQPNLNNSIDIKGKLTIQDEDLNGSDVREMKMMVEFLRYAISIDPLMHDLWIAYRAKEKILR